MDRPELTDADIARMLDQMWNRFLPDIEARAKTLENAAAAVSAGRLDAESRAAAESAAHKLSGTLGMFNLNRGTELAREFEAAVAPGAQLDSTCGERLAAIAGELRAMIASRKPGAR